MRKIKILWTDDEVEVLKPHIFFLEEKGYEIDTCSNGNDTIDLVRQNSYDLIFLDENMPGLSGIETLRLIREIRTDIPVVMITKSEEEEIMEAAIGSEIADYLIKPVKPKQILLAIKKILDQKRLVTEKTSTDYRQEFSRIGNMISMPEPAATGLNCTGNLPSGRQSLKNRTTREWLKYSGCRKMKPILLSRNSSQRII